MQLHGKSVFYPQISPRSNTSHVDGRQGVSYSLHVFMRKVFANFSGKLLLLKIVLTT